MLPGGPFRKGSLLSVFLFPKNSVVECWIVANRFVFLWSLACFLQIVFRSALFSSRTLTFRRPLYAVSNFVFFLCPQICPWLQQRRKQAFDVVFHENRNASHDFVFEERTTIFSVWCCLAIHPFEQYLQWTSIAMASAVLTVEADDNFVMRHDSAEMISVQDAVIVFYREWLSCVGNAAYIGRSALAGACVKYATSAR